MKFTDVQHKPELEVTQAEAAEMATQIRAKIGQQFDPVIAPITTKVTVLAITSNHDTGAVTIQVRAKTDGLKAIVMPPEGWIWFADMLDQASQSH